MPALFEDELVLLYFQFQDEYTTMFPLDLPRIVNMQRCVVLQNRVPQRSEVYNL